MSPRCSRFRSTPSPMMPEFCVIDGPTRSGVSSRTESSLNVGRQPFLRQFDAVALDAREADFERVALGPHGLDLDRLARRLRRRDDRLGGEVEGNAEDVGVLDVEQAVLVQVVGLAAQRAADDLLAQELRAEGADAEDVGDGVGVPAFGEHRDRDDAADRAAELAGLADGVHDFAQQFLVGDVLACAGVAGALDDLAAEALDLVGGHAAEVVVERIAGFELLAVDQQRVRARQRVAVSRRSCGTARGGRSPAWSVPSSFLRWKPEMKS